MEPNREQKKRFLFPHFSIQQRLPLIICVLLLLVIITFSLTSYIGVKKASLEVGRNRLHTLTDQLSSMFQQSAQALGTATRATAEQEAIKKYLQSDKRQSETAALEVLKKLRQDTSSLLVELLDSNHVAVLRSSKNEIRINVNIDSTLAKASKGPSFTSVGKLYLVGDSIYYPVIATVINNTKTKPLGYIVRWRLLKATPKKL